MLYYRAYQKDKIEFTIDCYYRLVSGFVVTFSTNIIIAIKGYNIGGSIFTGEVIAEVYH